MGVCEKHNLKVNGLAVNERVVSYLIINEKLTTTQMNSKLHTWVVDYIVVGEN